MPHNQEFLPQIGLYPDHISKPTKKTKPKPKAAKAVAVKPKKPKPEDQKPAATDATSATKRVRKPRQPKQTQMADSHIERNVVLNQQASQKAEENEDWSFVLACVILCVGVLCAFNFSLFRMPWGIWFTLFALIIATQKLLTFLNAIDDSPSETQPQPQLQFQHQLQPQFQHAANTPEVNIFPKTIPTILVKISTAVAIFCLGCFFACFKISHQPSPSAIQYNLANKPAYEKPLNQINTKDANVSATVTSVVYGERPRITVKDIVVKIPDTANIFVAGGTFYFQKKSDIYSICDGDRIEFIGSIKTKNPNRPRNTSNITGSLNSVSNATAANSQGNASYASATSQSPSTKMPAIKNKPNTNDFNNVIDELNAQAQAKSHKQNNQATKTDRESALEADEALYESATSTASARRESVIIKASQGQTNPKQITGDRKTATISNNNGGGFKAFSLNTQAVRGNSMPVILSEAAVSSGEMHGVEVKKKSKLRLSCFIKSSIVKNIVNASNANERGKGVVTALILGNTNFIDKEDRESISKSGFAHLLAISGLHISIVAGSIFIICRIILASIPWICLRYNTKKISAIVACLSMFLYFSLTTMSISATRSVIMFGAFLAGIMLDRKTRGLRIWCIAFFCILAIEPEKIFTPSMQMSFIATFTLIASYSKITQMKKFQQGTNSKAMKFLLYPVSIVISSAIAGFASIFFEMYHFHQGALAGIISNEIAIPVTEFILLPFSVLSVALMPFNMQWLALPISTNVGAFLCWLAQFCVSFKYSYFTTGAVSGYALFAQSLGVVSLVRFKKRSIILGLLLICFGLAINLIINH